MSTKPYKLSVNSQIKRKYEAIGTCRIVGRRTARKVGEQLIRAQGNPKFERRVVITKPTGESKSIIQMRFRRKSTAPAT